MRTINASREPAESTSSSTRTRTAATATEEQTHDVPSPMRGISQMAAMAGFVMLVAGCSATLTWFDKYGATSVDYHFYRAAIVLLCSMALFIASATIAYVAKNTK